MLCVLDSDKEYQAKISVKIIIPDNSGCERHITITDEGIIVDLVNAGEVIDTTCMMHDDIM